MHFVYDCEYLSDYKLILSFEDGRKKMIDLEKYLDGDIFEPLKKKDYFRTVKVNRDLDTIVWDNGADFSPEFLYDTGVDYNQQTQSKTLHS